MNTEQRIINEMAEVRNKIRKLEQAIWSNDKIGEFWQFKIVQFIRTEHEMTMAKLDAQLHVIELLAEEKAREVQP